MVRGLKGWRIATIRGVDLRVHVSLIFLLFYVVLVASAQFPAVVRESGVNPYLVDGSPIFWGLAFALALFVSVVFHEFGHVFMAQSLGVRVRGVTLMMLGGVSEMERIPEERYGEFKVAVVGPLVSFALAGLLFGVGRATQVPELEVFSFWLARVNLVLGIFNLLPAFPLDGGRAFRSVLVARLGAIRGTERAVSVAKGLAWVLGILGFLSFNLLLLLIAFFIYSAAHAELTILSQRERLRGLVAEEVGLRTSSLNEQETVGEAVERMIAERASVLPVQTSEGVPAVLPLSEIRKLPRERWGRVRTADLMLRPGRALDVLDPVEACWEELTALGAVPLTEGGRLIGLVRQKDVEDVVDFRELNRRSESANTRVENEQGKRRAA